MADQAEQIGSGSPNDNGCPLRREAKGELDEGWQDHGHQRGRWQSQADHDASGSGQAGGEAVVGAGGEVLGQRGQDGDADGGADDCFRYLHNQPAVSQSGHGAGWEAGGQIVLDDEDHLEGADGQDARPHQAGHPANAGMIDPQLRRPAEAEANQPRDLDQQVQGGAKYHAVDQPVHTEAVSRQLPASQLVSNLRGQHDCPKYLAEIVNDGRGGGQEEMLIGLQSRRN